MSARVLCEREREKERVAEKCDEEGRNKRQNLSPSCRQVQTTNCGNARVRARVRETARERERKR